MAAEVVTGPGPFREVPDEELNQIWYLTAQTTRLFEFIPIHTYPPPGFDSPKVKPLLRRMIYVVKLTPPQLQQLMSDIAALQSDRDMMAISPKLLSDIRGVYESPWAFPAVLETNDVSRMKAIFDGVSNATNLPANITSATPIAYVLSFLARAPGTAVANAAYAASLTNRYYGAYAQKMAIELALRGNNPALTN